MAHRHAPPPTLDLGAAPRVLLRAGLSLLCVMLAACGARPNEPTALPLPTPPVVRAAPPEPVAPVVVEAPPPEIIHDGVDRVARAALLALPFPDEGPLPPRTCVVESFVILPIDDVSSELSLESDARYTYDAVGRPVRMSWNSNPVGLSGEVRYRYDRFGDPLRTQETPFESIEGGRPSPPAPLSHRVTRSEGAVEVVSLRDGVVERTERYRYDRARRVVAIEVVDTSPDEPEQYTTTCSHEAVGRPAGYRTVRESADLERRLMYEGDRLIGLVQTFAGHDPLVASVWSSQDAVLVYWGESVDRYRGECAAQIFDPCAPRSMPALVRGEPDVMPMAVRFGRPLDPAAEPIDLRVHLITHLYEHDYMVLGEAGAQRGESEVDVEVDAEAYLALREREGELPEVLTSFGPDGPCPARAVRAVRLETMTIPYYDDEGRTLASYPAFDAIEIEAECAGWLAVEYDATGVALHAVLDEEERDDGSVLLTYEDDWTVLLRRGPPIDEICPGEPVYQVFDGRTRMGRFAVELSPFAVVSLTPERQALFVGWDMRRSLLSLPSGTPIAEWLDPALTALDLEANPCL